METNLFFAFISSLVISMILIPPLIKSAGRLQFIDFPGDRRMHTAPVARVGGIAFAAAAFVSILIWIPKDTVVLSYLLGGLIILCCGVWDDSANLHFRTKFLFQVLAALVVVIFGKVQITTLPFLDGTTLSLWLSIPITVVSILGITNAVNLSDGLDGLAGGLSLLSFSGLAFLAWLSGDSAVLVMVISILGGIFGFLRFNTYPARVFMGDGGSQFLGFSLGVLSLILTDSARGPYSPLIALLMVGLPVFDTIGVMIQRWRAGQSLFKADRNHIHHKLISAGLFHHEAVILIYLVQIILISLACLLRFQTDPVLISVCAGLAGIFFILFFKIGKEPLVWKRDEMAPISELLVRLKSSQRLSKLPIHFLSILVPLFLAVIVFVPPKIPIDFSHMAFGLLALLLTALLSGKGIQTLIRAGLYVGGAFGVYLSEEALASLSFFPHFVFILIYLTLAGLIILTVWTNKIESFQTTPLDFLILFIVLILSLLMKIEVGGLVLGLFAAKLIILFYAIEILLNRFSNRLGVLSGVSVWTLVIIGLRGWLL